jgi:2-polyprenyl-3-methyl-5-hydroxy-6-metoxy-1,4-benzoquinol methylase
MTWRYYGDPRPDIAQLVDPSGRSILDVGCGEGALAASLKEAGAAHVAGIELDTDAASVAGERLDSFVQGDVGAVPLPFEPEQFDYVIFADVLEHLSDPDLVLERMLPFLRPGGRVVVSVPNMRFFMVLLRLIVDRWSYTDAGIRDRTHLRIFTRRTLERMLRAHGLTMERLERNYRLFEDQSEIGRAGELATRIARVTLAPLFRDLMAFQYVAVARRSAAGPARPS